MTVTLITYFITDVRAEPNLLSDVLLADLCGGPGGRAGHLRGDRRQHGALLPRLRRVPPQRRSHSRVVQHHDRAGWAGEYKLTNQVIN